MRVLSCENLNYDLIHTYGVHDTKTKYVLLFDEMTTFWIRKHIYDTYEFWMHTFILINISTIIRTLLPFYIVHLSMYVFLHWIVQNYNEYVSTKKEKLQIHGYDLISLNILQWKCHPFRLRWGNQRIGG